MTNTDPDLQKLIDQNDQLIAAAEQMQNFDKVCRAEGVDPQRVRRTAAAMITPQLRAKADEELANELAEQKREMDAEAERRGLKKAASTGSRRRLGQMV